MPALVAGNSVLLKHSAKTPLCGEHFQAAFSHVPGLVTHLVLSHDQTLDLIRDARIDHVVFTGSVAGGRRVHPTAAGRGSGNALVVIKPGEPDQSILAYRMSSDEAGVAMPELGRALVHAEGVALIEAWIASMDEVPS